MPRMRMLRVFLSAFPIRCFFAALPHRPCGSVRACCGTAAPSAQSFGFCGAAAMRLRGLPICACPQAGCKYGRQVALLPLAIRATCAAMFSGLQPCEHTPRFFFCIMRIRDFKPKRQTIDVPASENRAPRRSNPKLRVCFLKFSADDRLKKCAQKKSGIPKDAAQNRIGAQTSAPTEVSDMHYTKRARRRASFRRRRAASFCLRLRMMLGFS